ncbi:MAG TPA: 50S ribosomal protein L11 methyltransferase [Polyangiaceae bacterium]
MTEPRHFFVAIDVAAEDADVTSGELFELGATGVEERDEGTLARGAAGKTTLVASFENEKAARDAQKKLGAGARIEELVGDAWRDAWKEHFRPFRLCQGLWVRPPWQEHAPKRGEKVLVLEPGRAFGTGLHETTRLVAAAIAMLHRTLPQTSVLDVGTGSGILALTAIALGAKDALGVDNDADAIEVAKENAARNAMSERAAFATTPIARVRGTFGLVLANIEADVLVGMKAALVARVAQGGRLVLSGILASREADVRAAFGKPIERAELSSATDDDKWVAMTYTQSR